jgi:hypothetical protein
VLAPVLRDRLEAFEQAMTGFDLGHALQLLRAAVTATPELSASPVTSD